MKKAAFEKAIDSFVGGGLTGHRDSGNSVTESIAWNSQLKCGTGMVKLNCPPVSHHYSRGPWFAKRVVEYVPPKTQELWKCFGGPATEKTPAHHTTTDHQRTVSGVHFTAGEMVEFRPASPVYERAHANFTSGQGESFRPTSPRGSE